MSSRTLFLALSLSAGVLTSAKAAVVFYVNNSAGFNAAIASSTLLGTEDWEQATIGANIAGFADPLAPGVASPNFPSGTNPAAGITAQSNILGTNPVNVSPFGANGLAVTGTGFLGGPSKQVSPNNFGHSLDLLVNPTSGPASAVSLQPLYINQLATSSTSHRGDVRVSVYDPSNVLLGTQVVPDVDYSQTGFIGIVGTDGSRIGRINVAALSSPTSATAGADGIMVFAPIPEPATAAISVLALAGLAVRRRRDC